MLGVRLLGELEIEVDGVRRPSTSGGRARALVGYLALAPRPHTRSALAGRLWPEMPEASARANLRTALWAARRDLGPAAAALAVDRERVGIVPALLRTDAARFADCVDAGRWRDAIALCRGPLLDGVEDDWALEARAAHEHLVGTVLAALADGAERVGRHEEAVAWAQRRVEHDLLDEAAACELMALLAAGGDRGEALAAYERLRRRLDRTVRAPPMVRTRRLADAIRARGTPG